MEPAGTAPLAGASGSLQILPPLFLCSAVSLQAFGAMCCCVPACAPAARLLPWCLDRLATSLDHGSHWSTGTSTYSLLSAQLEASPLPRPAPLQSTHRGLRTSLLSACGDKFQIPVCQLTLVIATEGPGVFLLDWLLFSVPQAVLMVRECHLTPVTGSLGMASFLSRPSVSTEEAKNLFSALSTFDWLLRTSALETGLAFCFKHAALK